MVSIEKCSSPTGDGNGFFLHLSDLHNQLRNVVPRQGTETSLAISFSDAMSIEKCSSPTGDGNKTKEYDTLNDTY